MQQLPYVVSTGGAIIANRKARNAFLAACRDVRLILVVMKLPEVKEDPHLRLEHEAAKRIGPLLRECQEGLPEEEANKVSAHII